MGFDEFDRRHHFAVAGRLKKAHVRGVGVDDVHVLEIDVLAAKLAAQLPGDDERSRRRRPARSRQEEGVAEMRDRGSPS